MKWLTFGLLCSLVLSGCGADKCHDIEAYDYCIEQREYLYETCELQEFTKENACYWFGKDWDVRYEECEVIHCGEEEE